MDLTSSALFFSKLFCRRKIHHLGSCRGNALLFYARSGQPGCFCQYPAAYFRCASGTLFSLNHRLPHMEELREPRNYFSLLRQSRKGSNAFKRDCTRRKYRGCNYCCSLSGHSAANEVNYPACAGCEATRKSKKEFTILTTISCVSGFAMFIPIKASVILD